jgi:hypothetical protein
MKIADRITASGTGGCMKHPGSAMQISRRLDEMVFCHAMEADELKAHLERLAVPGDCSLCEWFGKSS